MTDEQRERIRAAARELARAMTGAGNRFDLECDRINMSTLDSGRAEKLVYSIRVIQKTSEVIS